VPDRRASVLFTGRHIVRHNKATRYVILIAITLLAPTMLTSIIPRAHAAPTYTLGTIPFLGQEGTTFTVVLQVGGASGSTAYQYQRTQTVSVQATGYGLAEPATVKIATGSTPPRTVLAENTTASLSGVVVASWRIPPNATLDPNGYIVTVTGTTTVKTPADVSGFNVSPASMSISSLNSLKSIYQRTETMSFSFQPIYPDGTIASTGVALLTLARPGGANVTLTTASSSGSQTFNATYKTSATNVTGTWTASLASNAYADAWGNSGPSTKLTSTPQLVPATLSINVAATTYVPIGQQ